MPDSITSFDDRSVAVRYVDAFRRHWVLIIGLVVAAVGAAAVHSFTATERYETSADLIISPLDQGDLTFRGFTMFRRGSTTSSSVVVAARVLGSSAVYEETYGRLGARGRGVSVYLQPLSQADVVLVRATAPDPQVAALAANTFAEAAVAERTAVFQQELLSRIGSLQSRAAAIPASAREGNFEYASLRQQLGELRGFVGASDPTVRVLRPATPPASPSWPRTRLSIAVALFAALLIGASVAVGLELFNPRVMREVELTHGHRLPILARIPRMPTSNVRGYLTGERPSLGPAWQGYRTLRAVLATAGGGTYPRSILVTSATSGDGKTMTAINLAITLATANVRVILVDADPFRPMVAGAFQARGAEDGFVRLLAGDDHVAQMLVPAGDPPGLRLVLSSREHVPYMHLLDRERVAGMLDRLSEHADVVVFDSPPVTEVAETLALADGVDAVLVAVRLGHTRRDKLAQLHELLARRNVTPFGFVVTVRDTPSTDRAYNPYVASIPATTAPLPRNLWRPGPAPRWVPAEDEPRTARIGEQ